MKPSLLLVCLVLAALAGALGGVVATRNPSASATAPTPLEPEPARLEAPSAASFEPAFEARLERLADEMESLRGEVAGLRAGATRTPVAQVASDAEGSPEAFAAQHKEAILQVIALDREEQERQREAERAQREIDALLARAERTAQRFGLSPEQQKSLADVYQLERVKMEDLRASLRGQRGLRDNPDLARESIQELRAWRDAELGLRLGSDLAQKISAYERDRGGWRRRGAAGENDAAPGGSASPGGNR